MTPLPSAVRGNSVPSSENILLRPPSFEKFMKASRRVQQKPLQLERRFSHYEQKVTTAPIDKFNKRIPRRLQTRKVVRPYKSEPSQYFDEDKITWNPRLAAWIYDDQNRQLQYIKISDKYDIIEKQLYYCCACHEFFHANLREREKRDVTCPRFGIHHEVREVHPLSIKRGRKSGRKRPPIQAKDPFTKREDIVIPALQPPRPVKRPTRVIVDIPRLPSIPQTTTTQRTSVVTNTRSRQEISPGPEERISTVEERAVSSKLPDIFQTDFISGNSSAQNTPELQIRDEIIVINPETSGEDEDGVFVEKEEEDVDDACVEDESHVTDAGIETVSITNDIDKFDDVASNVLPECSELGESSLECDVNLSVGSSAYEDESGGDTDLELQLPSVTPSPNYEMLESPPRARPRPPPPDLPVFRMQESPETPKYEGRAGKHQPEKRRKSVFLPMIQPVKTKKPPTEKPRRRGFTKEEIAKRMNRAKEIEGYRRKYELNAEEGYEVNDEDAAPPTPPSSDLYDDSFLEKFCLVSPDHLRKSKRVFDQIDKDQDGYLTSEEVIAAMQKMYSPVVLDDVDMCYVFRILETTSFDIFAEKMSLKLFAIVTALAEKISKLDEYMKHLIGRVNIEVVDWKLCRAKTMFEQTMQRGKGGKCTMSMESLWIELHAGGISEQHEKKARRTLQHMKEMDVLDFFTYLPLFLFVHSNVVENPLNSERSV